MVGWSVIRITLHALSFIDHMLALFICIWSYACIIYLHAAWLSCSKVLINMVWSVQVLFLGDSINIFFLEIRIAKSYWDTFQNVQGYKLDVLLMKWDGWCFVFVCYHRIKCGCDVVTALHFLQVFIVEKNFVSVLSIKFFIFWHFNSRYFGIMLLCSDISFTLTSAFMQARGPS